MSIHEHAINVRGEEALQVGKLPVDVAEDLDGRLHVHEARARPQLALDTQPADLDELLIGAHVPAINRQSRGQSVCNQRE